MQPYSGNWTTNGDIISETLIENCSFVFWYRDAVRKRSRRIRSVYRHHHLEHDDYNRGAGTGGRIRGPSSGCTSPSSRGAGPNGARHNHHRTLIVILELER
jgi:hypothetical protein